MPKKPIAYRGSEPFVFVSYAHADAELAYPIISGLQERGMRIWFDDGMDVGDIWDEVIPDHVEQCTAMLCLVSTRFTDSDNCLDEIHYAKEQKKELLILHLEDEELPRNFRFRYGRFHALRLSTYSDHGALLDKLAATQKLRCCIGQVKENPVEPQEKPTKPKENPAKQKEDFEELLRKGADYYAAGSYEEAVRWFRRAADSGNAEAMCRLGRCYYWGKGVAKSDEEAVSWFRRAADKGNAEGMGWLGYCYKNGWGVPMDQKQANYWKNKEMQTRAAASK